jgi:predicted enzyme related to lactoylglutathione lyase
MSGPSTRHTRIGGAILVVADQDVMIEFFRKVGFELTTDEEMWPGARWVDMTPPGERTRLVLNAAKDFDREPDPGYPMVFETADVQAEAERLRAAGLEVTGPKTEPWGTFVTVADPEGRDLMIGQRG